MMFNIENYLINQKEISNIDALIQYYKDNSKIFDDYDDYDDNYVEINGEKHTLYKFDGNKLGSLSVHDNNKSIESYVDCNMYIMHVIIIGIHYNMESKRTSFLCVSDGCDNRNQFPINDFINSNCINELFIEFLKLANNHKKYLL
jgi:hypothetical protein